MECKQCFNKMEKKIENCDMIIHWCHVCGTALHIAPDLEDFKAWWVPVYLYPEGENNAT